jgi:SAM-dependent methyltransferase
MDATGRMNPNVLVRQSETGDKNWWIAVRKSLFKRIFTESKSEHRTAALEIGPGAGSNLEIFTQLGVGQIYIADTDSYVLEMCSERSRASGVLLDASALPYANESFDLLLAGDVLEHVPNDVFAAQEIVRVMKKGARAIITVPAFEVLWSEHDEQAGHQRRYRLREFKNLFSEQEIIIERCHYFNWILFLPTLLVKKLLRFFKPNTYADATSLPSRLNLLLKFMFNFDVRLAKLLQPPFGVSIIIVLDKPMTD